MLWSQLNQHKKNIHILTKCPFFIKMLDLLLPHQIFFQAADYMCVVLYCCAFICIYVLKYFLSIMREHILWKATTTKHNNEHLSNCCLFIVLLLVVMILFTLNVRHHFTPYIFQCFNSPVWNTTLCWYCNYKKIPKIFIFFFQKNYL